MTVDLARLKSANQARWNVCKVYPALLHTLDTVAGRLVAAKHRYQAVEEKTGVPWAVIAVIHERESSQSWQASLAQGDPWNRVSVHVPKGRGPFGSWEEAAIDALVVCPPHAAKWHDWTTAGALTLLEQYNGVGYFLHGMPSPYIWASTDQYRSGKYVSDGHFDPNAVDHQMGCAALLMRMAVLDPSISGEWHP